MKTREGFLEVATAPWVAHALYKMQACAVHRGIMTVGREPNWGRLNSEYHKALDPFFIPC